MARHPSESDEYLVARVLAYCLEYTEGIEFSNGGLSDPDEPPIAVRDLTGALTSVDRHRLAGRRAAAHAPASWPRAWPSTSTGIRRNTSAACRARASIAAARSSCYALDRALIANLVARLERRMAFALSVTDRDLYLSIADATLTGAVTRLSLE